MQEGVNTWGRSTRTGRHAACAWLPAGQRSAGVMRRRSKRMRSRHSRHGTCDGVKWMPQPLALCLLSSVHHASRHLQQCSEHLQPDPLLAQDTQADGQAGSRRWRSPAASKARPGGATPLLERCTIPSFAHLSAPHLRIAACRKLVQCPSIPSLSPPAMQSRPLQRQAADAPHLVVQAAARRVYQEHLHPRPPLLQVARHACYRTAGARPRHKGIHPPPRLLPDLLPCGGRCAGRREQGIWEASLPAPTDNRFHEHQTIWGGGGAGAGRHCELCARLWLSCWLGDHALTNARTHMQAGLEATVAGCRRQQALDPRPPVRKCALKLAGFSNWSAKMALGCSAAWRRATFTKWLGWVMDTGRSCCTSAPRACGMGRAWGGSGGRPPS